MIQRCCPAKNLFPSCFFREALSAPSARRHIRALNSTDRCNDASIDKPILLSEPIYQETENKGPKVDLEQKPRVHPVLQVRDALFEAESPLPKSQWMRALRRSIAVQGDLQNVAVWLRGRRCPLKTSDINALQARLQYLGETLGPKGILQSMLSVVRKPAAIKQRLLAHEAATDKTVSLPDYCQLFFRKISAILETSPGPQGDHWHDWYTKQQWLHVITGWNRNGTGELGERRAWCLYNLGPDLDVHCWNTYLELLCRFGTSNVIYSEWKLHQQSHVVLMESLNNTIQSLLKLKDPGKAWGVAYEFGNGAELINRETWELLLAHPQYIREWMPYMNGPALRMLENELCKVEGYLGLRWEGGENGYHRIDGHRSMRLNDDATWKENERHAAGTQRAPKAFRSSAQP